MAAFHANGAASTGGLRDSKDRYETPDEALDALMLAFGAELSCAGPVVDPCCGTGRLVRRARSYGWTSYGTDIEEDGLDFLSSEYEAEHDPDAACVTNPPFSHAEAFVRRALDLFRGPVAMLLPADFLWSQERRDWLSGEGRPASAMLIPWRIKFYQRDGTRISGQAYSHQWVVWPERDMRPSGTTVLSWADLGPYLEAKSRWQAEAREAKRGLTPAGKPGQDAATVKDGWEFLS